MKNKVLVSILLGSMLLSTAGCGSDTSSSTASVESAATVEQEPIESAVITAQEATETTSDVANGKFKDFTLTYKNATIGENYKAEPIIIMNFDFTNLTENNASFTFSTDVKAFQDGISLERVGAKEEGYDFTNAQKDIKKDITIDVQDAFILSNVTSPIEVEIKPLFSFDDSELYTFTIDPTTLTK